MRYLRFLPVFVLMLLLATTALAQNVSITVAPESGAVGTTFNVTVAGLTPNTDYTLAFIFEEDSSTVFTTSRTANASGQIAMNVSSESSDLPGSYRVEVRSNDTTLADATFTLTGNALQPPSGNASGVQLRVSPVSGDIGSTFDIDATGLAASQSVTVSITFAGEEVYRRSISADENGAANLQVFTQAGDGTGDYNVQLLDAGGTVLAGDTFAVVEPTGRNGIVRVSQDGAAYTIAISEVKPFADLTVQVISNATRQPVFTNRVRASVDGAATVEFTPDAGTTSGDYTISVTEGANIEVAAGSLTLGETAALNAQSANLRVTPVSAAPGTLRIITGSGLLAGETVTIEIINGSGVIYSEAKTADVNGTVALSVKTLGSDAPGDYAVNLKRGSDLVAETALTIEAASITAQPENPPQQVTTDSDIQVEIDPPGGPLGTVYDIRVSGLQPNETVTIAVMFNGRTVFAAERTSNNTGVATLNISSEEGDTPGTYSVTVMRGDTTVASSDFQVGGDAVETPPATTDTAEVTVSPAAGERGTVHVITVSDLTPGETVTVDVLFNGASVYATERTADNNGSISLSLSSSASDEAGDYTINIQRDSDIIAQGTMTVLDTGTEPPANTDDIVLTIAPAAGVRGDDHAITVTGLEPDEQVTIEVVFDGAVVYSTERTADASGLASVVLSTEAGDPTGDYTIRVQRNNEIAAEGTLSVTDTATTEPPAGSEVAVRVSPESGPAGTSHAITIRNLAAGETITVNVLFDGSVQFTTEKTADRAGTIMMRLVAAEDDPKGVYTVQVLRDNAVIGQADMTVEGGVVENTTPPATTQTTTGEGLLNITAQFNGFEQTYTFEGEAGQAVVAQVASDDFDTYLTLRDNDGIELVSNDDFGGSLNSLIGPYILPYSGEYTVVVSSYDIISGGGGVSGTFTVNASTTTLSEIEYGQAVTADFTPASSAHYFSFEANEGDIIGIEVNSSGGIDTTLTLNDPAGVQVMVDDDSGSGYDPEITRYIAITSGEYVVMLSGYTLGDSGNAQIVVNREVARSLSDGAQQVRLNAKQIADVVTYQGSAGEQVLMSVDVVSGSPEGATISVIQNGITLMTYSAQDIPAGTMLGFSIPDSGIVSITVQSDGITAATLEFALRREQQ